MPEREISIHHNRVVGRKLEAILSPWSSVPKEQLPEIMKGVSISVIELARRAGVSPQQALSEAPSRIELNGQDFRVVRSSRNGHHGVDGETQIQSPNLRIKKLIRDSVKEPPIKGVRNGGMRLDEKVLKRKMAQACIERERLVFQATEPFDKDKVRGQRRAAIHARIADRFLRRSESRPADDNLEQEQTSEVINLGEIITRTDIPSTLGPFEFAPNCEVRFPPEVIKTLGERVEEHARVFSKFVPENTEGNQLAYQHCVRTVDGCVTEPFFQVDIAGLSHDFLAGASTVDQEEVARILRGRIFEFESSIAMYGLIETLGGGGLLGTKFREHLDLIRAKHDKPIVLLAPTKEKLKAMRETEFGKVGTQVLTSKEVNEISGFDALWGPDEFREHLEQHGGECKSLLYVRPSDPIFKLKDPEQKVASPLLGHSNLRGIIRENAITLNIDNPFWPTGDTRRIKDSKAALPLIGMGFRVDTVNDVIANNEPEEIVVTNTFSEFMNSSGLSQLSSFRAKPMQGVFGGYGQKTMNFLDRHNITWLEEMLSLRGPYIIQPEIEPLVVTDSSTRDSFAVIDRAFFSMVKGVPEFMGGVRILVPLDSGEAQRRRLHGTSEMISAPILSL